MKATTILTLILICACSYTARSQDSVKLGTVIAADTGSTVIKVDTPRIKRHDPRVATRRSLILPGWGQAYNREYWKIPIVWGALGTCVGFWIYNNTWYHRTRFAYTLVVNHDTSRYGEIHPRLIRKATQLPADEETLQFLRNSFRRDRDYSLLYFVGAWALNIADATVFGHLKEFDVSDDLSLKVKPNLNPFNRTAGLTLAMNFR
jgi:hypothetical protein